MCLFSRYQFAQLIQLQKRLGKTEFPLVEQAYYPNYKEMVSQWKKSFTCRLLYASLSKSNFKKYIYIYCELPQ